MINFSFEITQADPETQTLVGLYVIGDEEIPFPIRMAPDDNWDAETIAIRGYHAIPQILRFIEAKNKPKPAVVTAEECAGLVGQKFTDTYDPHPTLSVPKPPDFHPIRQGRRTVGLSKTPADAEWEVYERDPDEAARQLLVFRRDYGCSPAQLRIQLLKRDALGDIDEAMRSQPREVEIEWEYSNSMLRTSAVATVIQNTLKLSDEEIDDLWIAAQQVEIDRRRIGP